MRRVCGIAIVIIVKHLMYVLTRCFNNVLYAWFKLWKERHCSLVQHSTSPRFFLLQAVLRQRGCQARELEVIATVRHRTIRLMAASVHLLPNRCLVSSGHSPLHTATWPPHQPHRPSPGHVWCTDGENSAILTSILSASYGPFYRVFREGHYSGIYNSSFEK